MATDLHDLLQTAVDSGQTPGAVALVARGDDVELATAGTAELGGGPPMARDSLFRIASLTKPVTAALAMLLVEEGLIGLLSPRSRHLMLTDHLTAEQRAASRRFLAGQGWGVGGSVDVAETEPWNVVGRYGWTGGTGTAAHVIPATGTVTILLSTAAMPDPAATPLQKAFWTYAAR